MLEKGETYECYETLSQLDRILSTKVLYSIAYVPNRIIASVPRRLVCALVVATIRHVLHVIVATIVGQLSSFKVNVLYMLVVIPLAFRLHCLLVPYLRVVFE